MSKKRWIIIIITILIVLGGAAGYYRYQSGKLKSGCPEGYKEECNYGRCTCNKQPCEFNEYICTDGTKSGYINELCVCDNRGLNARRGTGLK